MRFGEYVFRFRPGLTLLLALPAILFVALGLWQLDRAEQKRAEAQTEEARAASPSLRIDSLVTDSQGLRHRQVQVEGRFEPDRQFFIEGRREGGRNGLHVITPLRLSGSEERRLTKRVTANNEAYLAYLRGRQLWNLRTASSLHEAISAFERAVALDPLYAEAYAALGERKGWLAFASCPALSSRRTYWAIHRFRKSSALARDMKLPILSRIMDC